jgi:hypothetical protein
VKRIDAHTHVFAPAQAGARGTLVERDATFAEMYADPKAKMASVEDLLGELDSAGFDGAVVAGFAFGTARDIDEQNEYLRHMASIEGHRLKTLATVNPSQPGWRQRAERSLQFAAGFGELRPHNQEWDPLGQEGRALCGLARERDAVLLWHVSEPVGHQYPGKRGGISPWELCTLAEAFPGLRMVAAHLGGGLPFFLQMPEIRQSLLSVSFDTAATSLLYDEACVSRAIDLAGRDRVLFGSDYPLLPIRRQSERAITNLAGDIARAVCGGNAEALYWGPDYP